MKVEIAGRVTSTLPADDDHPYRTGAWQPNFVEYDATDLDVDRRDPRRSRRRLPAQHREPGAPVDRPAVPPVRRRRHAAHDPLRRRPAPSTATASCAPPASPPSRTRADALWSGILGGPDAVAARRRLGRAHADEGRVEHRRRRARRPRAHVVLPMRRSLRLRSGDARAARRARRGTARSRPTGASPRTRRSTSTPARCSCSTTRRTRRTCTTASSTRTTSSCTGSTCRCPARACRTTWRSPSTTRSSTTARCSGTPTCSRKGAHVPRFRPDLPTRFAVIPRRGATADIRWFEADPTYVLHWANAYEDGDEIVLDGFFQGDPMPKSDGETDLLPARVPRHRHAPHADRAAALAHEPRDRARARKRRCRSGSWSSR